MTLCELITNPITRMVDEGKNLDEIAEAVCPTIQYGREKIIRVIKDFLGEEYLIQHAEVLGYDVGKAQLAKKRTQRSHKKIDATTDTVIESNSVTPASSCQTTVQAVNTEHEGEAGQTKGQEKEQVLEEHDKPGACCQERASKAVRKKRDSEEETTEQELDNAPLENKFNVLVEAIRKLIKLSSIEDVKKALALAERDI
jgi:spore germination protein GerM